MKTTIIKSKLLSTILLVVLNFCISSCTPENDLEPVGETHAAFVGIWDEVLTTTQEYIDGKLEYSHSGSEESILEFKADYSYEHTYFPYFGEDESYITKGKFEVFGEQLIFTQTWSPDGDGNGERWIENYYFEEGKLIFHYYISSTDQLGRKLELNRKQEWHRR